MIKNRLTLLCLLASLSCIPYVHGNESSVIYALQQISIEGVVKDDQGISLEGVSVSVKGRSASTSTDTDGSYSIDLRSEEHTSELQSRFDLVCRRLRVWSCSFYTLFPYTTLFRSFTFLYTICTWK